MIRSDATARPVALLQRAALRSAAAPSWMESAGYLTAESTRHDEPLLDGQRLPVSRRETRSLLAELAGAARQADIPGTERWERGFIGSWRAGPLVDPFRLLHASIVASEDHLTEIGAATGLEPSVIATLGHLVALPLLLACGRRTGELRGQTTWTDRFCPMCGAWPLLAERRGMERQPWLRCGRCASGWRTLTQQCLFCANTDHRTLGYLAPDADRESRRAIVCQGCRGYLKAITTMAPLTAPELIAHDLGTLELDVAALDEGYQRPHRQGAIQRLELVPIR